MSATVSDQAQKTISIVGGGIAGLCAGCYAQMNGYHAHIHEMHDRPGGVMTAWERKGYTMDYCIHWLVGSSPRSSLHKLWREVGLLRDREIVDLDIWAEYESADGRRITFWRDLDRLERHLVDLFPDDAELVGALLKDARKLAAAEMPVDLPPRELMRPLDMARMAPKMAPWLLPMRRWGKLTIAQMLERVHDPLLRKAIASLWPPQSGAMFLITTFAWLHAGEAGYPIGGSMPLARNLERRFTELGGEITYKSKVERILTHRTGGTDRASGLTFADGTEERAEIVISAADGHETLYEMLEGRYLEDLWRGLYEREELPLFTPILFAGIGVARDFSDEVQCISGIRMPLDEPIDVGGRQIDELHVRIGNFDPTMAPAGKTVLGCMIATDGPYWIELRERDREAYTAEKARVSQALVHALDRRYPGLKEQVEVIDLATPATTVRYTGNWRASFEGWLPTPEYLTKGLPRRLAGLDDFYMVGQWVQPGGGLPTGVLTAREVLQLICKRDGRPFRTSEV